MACGEEPSFSSRSQTSTARRLAAADGAVLTGDGFGAHPFVSITPISTLLRGGRETWQAQKLCWLEAGQAPISVCCMVIGHVDSTQSVDYVQRMRASGKLHPAQVPDMPCPERCRSEGMPASQHRDQHTAVPGRDLVHVGPEPGLRTQHVPRVPAGHGHCGCVTGRVQRAAVRTAQWVHTHNQRCACGGVSPLSLAFGLC